MKFAACAFPLFVCCSLAGPVTAQTSRRSGAGKMTKKSGSLVLVKTDKAFYKPTEPIKLSMTFQNNTKTPMKMEFSSGQVYDFHVWFGKPETGELVWSWGMDKRFMAMLQNKMVASAKTLAYSEIYLPGKPLKPGTYTVVGTLTTRSEKRPKGAATFKVAGETTSARPAAGGLKVTGEEALVSVPKTDPQFEEDARNLAEAEAALKDKPNDEAAKKACVEAAYTYGHKVMGGTSQVPPAIKYRAALALYRRALKIDAGHQPSLDDKKTIEDIYTQMGRAVPQ